MAQQTGSRRLFLAAAAGPRLLLWYRRNRRDLPWRRTRDPYRIWVSEIMLQQTQVATVIPYYVRFLRRFPTLRSLALAPLPEVLAAWSGLGYYRRARHLHSAARQVMEGLGGTIPREAAHLRRLPGVGRYTAGALASIAFGRPEPALDGNGMRVLSRMLALRGNPETSPNRQILERAARSLLAAGPAGEVNQALMELGALVCTPAAPLCLRCPARRGCRAHAAGLEAALPEVRRGRAAVDLEAAVAVIRRGRACLLVQRADRDLMKGLWEFPGGVLKAGERPAEALARLGRDRLGVALRAGERIAELRQSITYRRVRVGAYAAILSEPLPRRAERNGTKMRWVRPSDLAGLPHGSATRRIFEKLRKPSSPSASRPPRRQRVQR
jgi:A/G-specific adenine glycosylase